jgi:epoxyqueuosine reductase
MDISEISRTIYSELERNGYKGRIVSAQRLSDLKEEIEVRHRTGIFDEDFYLERLAGSTFAVEEQLPGARSLIITAAPQARQRVGFCLKGRHYHFEVPPTYSNHTDAAVQSVLSRILAPMFRLEPLSVPEKLLAARSGLARYGRNNIAYVDGMGSFHRLRAFVSDLPSIGDEWIEPEAVAQCDRCTACLSQCPTGAIASDRFVILAEKCLTFHNERPDAFPDWIDLSWHNCLIGCMLCQSVCQVNKRFKNWFENTESFGEEETRLLAEGVSRERLPKTTTEKLQRLCLLEDLDMIERNLGVLLKQHSF